MQHSNRYGYIDIYMYTFELLQVYIQACIPAHNHIGTYTSGHTWFLYMCILLYMYTCIYTYSISVQMHIGLNATCTSVYMHICGHACCNHAWLHTCTCISVYMHSYIHGYLYALVWAVTYTLTDQMYTYRLIWTLHVCLQASILTNMHAYKYVGKHMCE